MTTKASTRINHPSGKSLVASAQRILRDNLQNPKGIPRNSFFPDAFLAQIMFWGGGGKPWFSKRMLYRAVAGKVRRPSSQLYNFSPRWKLLQKPTRNDWNITQLTQQIQRYGSVFLKPTTLVAAEGNGIVRIEKTTEGLRLTASTRGFFQALCKNCPANAVLHENDLTIVIPLSRRQPLQIVLSGLIAKNFEYHYITEREINIPPYHGKKWEFRTYIQSPNGNPEIIGHVAKVAGEGIVANVRQGGEPAEAATIIFHLYRRRYPKKTTAEISSLTEEFFQKSNNEAKKAVIAINGLMKKYARKYINGFPVTKLYVRQAGVDNTGEFNPTTGKMEPIVVEVQYPNFGGLEDLQKQDPVAYHRFMQNEAKMREEGKRILAKAFDLP